MADFIPVKAAKTNGVATGLAEFAVGDTVPIAQGGTGVTTIDALKDAVDGAHGAWTTFTPPISAASGSLANANATVRYQRIGRFVYFTLVLAIIDNGTGGAAFNVYMPVIAATTSHATGRENAVTGYVVQGQIGGNSNLLVLRTPDNGYPGGNGRNITMTGFYEAAS